MRRAERQTECTRMLFRNGVVHPRIRLHVQSTSPLSMIQFFDNCLVELRPDLAGLQPTQGVDSTTLREPDEEG